MSQALERFGALRKKFRAMIPTRKLSAMQHHHIAWAASLQRAVEVTVAEAVLGKPHDHDLIQRMQSEVRARLAAAGARNPPGGRK